MIPIKHHYIPKFYLKQWVKTTDVTLCEFSRPYDVVKPKRVSPGGTGYLNRLYALRGFSDDLAQQVEERFFKVVDNGAADAITLMIERGSRANLSVDQRSAWSRFIVSLLTRTPEDVQEFRTVWGDYLSTPSEDAARKYPALRGESDPPTFSQYLASRPIAEREKELFEAFMGIIDNPSLGAKLNSHPFWILDFPYDAVELFTSDRPIIRDHSGLSSPNGHLALPIGPRKLFITAPNESVLRAIESANRKSVAKEANRIVVRQAIKYVYSSSDEGLSFVRKHFSKVQEPRLISAEMLGRVRQRKARQEAQ